jgi:hypothetical protein
MKEDPNRSEANMDNSPTDDSRSFVGCLAAIKARRVPPPADAIGRSPSDFFVFGHLKGKLCGTCLEIREESISMIRGSLASITNDQLIAFDMNSRKRLKWAISNYRKHDHR